MICEGCGCTDERACVHEATGTVCGWAEEDLCTFCAYGVGGSLDVEDLNGAEPGGARKVPTYWNGERCYAVRCLVVLARPPADAPKHWARGKTGTERRAVEVRWPKYTDVFYLDDDDGTGWGKVTRGFGSPAWGHRSLPVEAVLEYLD